MLPPELQSELGETDTPLASPASESATADNLVAYSEQEKWAFVQALSVHSLSMEMRAAIIFPAEVLALLVLWEHLHDFDSFVPRTFAWIAWSLLILGIFTAGWLIAPRAAAWGSLLGDGYGARKDAERSGEALVDEIYNDLHARTRLLTAGIRFSVLASLVALAITVVAYAIEKTS
jgi:hypothetical protein